MQGRSWIGARRRRIVGVLAHAGSAVTLAALVLLGATAAGALLGDERPTVTVTYDR